MGMGNGKVVGRNLEFDRNGKLVGLMGKGNGMGLGYVERKRIERLMGLMEMEERVNWGVSLVDYRMGCDDCEKGMLSSRVKVGKRYYCRRDRRK